MEADPPLPVTLAQGYEAGGCLAGTRYCRVTPEGELTACPYMEESAGMSVPDVGELVGRCLGKKDLQEMGAWKFTVRRYNVLDGPEQYRVRAEGKR